MLRSIRLTLLACVVLGAGAAVGQPVFPPGPRPDAIRIQVQISIQAPMASSAAPNERLSLQDAGRRAMYEAASRECRVLTEVFGGSCRLLTLNAGSQIQARPVSPGMSGEFVLSTATATYELLRSGAPSQPGDGGRL